MVEWTNEIRVPYADTDAMGIVYHSNYIKYFEMGRGELLRGLGFSYRRMEEEGVMLPVIECACQYKTPAVYDDVICVHSTVAQVKGATITLNYEVRRKEDGALLAKGMSKHAVTDHSLKPVRLKEHFPQLYRQLSAE